MRNCTNRILICFFLLKGPCFSIGFGQGAIGFELGGVSSAAQFGNNYNQSISFGGYLLQPLPYFNLGNYFPFDLKFSIHYANQQLKNHSNSSFEEYQLSLTAGYRYSMFSLAEPYVFFGSGIGVFNSVIEPSLTQDNIAINNSFNRPIVKAGLGLRSQISNSLSLDINGSYRYVFLTGGSYESLNVNTGVALKLDLFFSNETEISIGDAPFVLQEKDIVRVYPALYNFYNQSGLGSLTIKNRSNEMLNDLSIVVQIDGLDLETKKTIISEELAPDEEVSISVPIFFDESIIKNASSRDASLKFTFYYNNQDGSQYTNIQDYITILSKNSLSWNDPGYLSSFISPMDESLSELSRKMISELSDNKKVGINDNLENAAILFNALGLLGLSYVKDPTKEFFSSPNKSTNTDYVMFGIETLKSKAGDCDDLTVLYASLLHSVGIETVILTTPGHVFPAFNTGVPINNYYLVANKPELLFYYQGSVWVPLETTMLKSSFLQAWESAAKQIEKYQDSNDWSVTRVSKAWQKYPPPSLTSLDTKLNDKDLKLDFWDLSKRFVKDQKYIIEMNYEEPIAQLKKQIEKQPTNVKLLNKAGILQAMFGERTEAKLYFEKALELNDSYAPAYANLANLEIIDEEYEKAEKLLQKAIKLQPENPIHRINIAKLYFDKGKVMQARKSYKDAVALDPNYKGLYSYLNDNKENRAAGAVQEKNLWVR